ncbi:MAG: sigma-54-dependent Fis family transcriptional regulator [Pseudomonadota bacterium]
MSASYVERSHSRCMSMGIPLDRIYSAKIISGEELQKKLEEKRELIITAGPFIDQLYNFVKGSGFFAMLTDEEGCILNMIGDDVILSEAYRFKMIPGAYMDEINIGTNAMGTAIAEAMPVQISGKEHFVTAYHRWTCSGAPIRNTEGRIIGSLDLTGYSEKVHAHTLGMVVAATDAIEKMLVIKEYNSKLTLANNHFETIMESLVAGMLTADMDGRILMVNNYALNMFGFSKKEILSKYIYQLFENWEKVIETLKAGESFQEVDVYVNTNTNKLQFSLSAYPIYGEARKLQEVIYVFKEIKRIRNLANRIMGSKAIYTFDKIVGSDERFLEVMEYAKKVSDSRSTILITGESGTGKEVFAQAIHNFGDRREEPFVAINCGAIPRNLMESELFGYEEGAFTGAKKGGAPGKFEIADGGTLMLDEIGDMPIDMQIKLLRVIEEGVITRVGGTRQIPINVRIIAATNKNLVQEVENGNFRLDLYYRLNVLPIHLPALRERRGDIEAIARYFMKSISKRLNKKEVYLDDDIIQCLKEYNWPGNIRELENVIERMINTQNMPAEFSASESASIEIIVGKPECLDLEQTEIRLIKKALTEYGGNITLAAKALGIGRNTLYRKMEKHKIVCTKTEQ